MKIQSVEFITSVVKKEQFPQNGLDDILLLGRSNVGKSSFINTILNRKKVAFTSSRPGKTQTLNYFAINEKFNLVDAPGYGYAKVSKKIREQFGIMIEEYLTNRKELKRIFLLVDARHKPTEDDIMMYDYMSYYDLPITIIATKTDKLKRNDIPKTLKELRKYFDAEIVLFSSFSKVGIEEVHSIILNSIDRN